MQPYIKLYLDSLNSENSKKSIVKNLRAILRRLSNDLPITDNRALTFDWHTQSLEQYSFLKTELINDARSSSYINTLLTVLRQVLTWAMINGNMPEKKLENIKQVIKSVSSNKKRQASKESNDDEFDLDWLMGDEDNLNNLNQNELKKRIDETTVERLFNSIGRITTLNHRDRAIFMCMSNAGLRREEVAQLRLSNLYFSKTPGQSFIKVIGKGAKVRNVPISKKLNVVLLHWAKLVISSDNKRKSSFLFRKINSIGKVLNAGLSNDAIYKIIKGIGTREGVQNIHPHKLRHFFATRLLLDGCDIFEVAKLLGHSNIETTRKYDDRGFETLQRAVENFAA